ncbi:MAG: hypothetical protein SGI77_00305 [Pirellulaceae bacterium]|nr:hypothetical protein [Pirellulaceae bacterium]
MSKNSNRPTLAEMFLQHLIVFLICIVFPGVVTSLAPATWLTFKRSGEIVHCTARTCVFFVIPFKVQEVDDVKEIGHRERAGRTERKREFGRTTDKIVHVDGEGFLQIHGQDDTSIEVSVSPASLQSVADKSNRFLNSSQEVSLTIFAIANWKFGAIMGGVLTSFTALYVVGYSLGFFKLIITGATKKLNRDSGRVP